MKTKPWITATLGAVIVIFSMSAGTAFAEHRYAVGKTRPDNGNFDYARVISAQPIVRYVTVAKPVRECWEETRTHAVSYGPNHAGGTILGAIIGGVVGHQIGSGRGNDAATVAGSVIGAAIGNNASRRRYDSNGSYGTTRYSTPVQRCETRYRKTTEERIDGYRVVYRYHGQKYATRMPYDPGKKIRIRVDVRPARY